MDLPMVSSTSAGRRAVVENMRVYAALATGLERAAARRSCGRMIGRGGRIGPESWGETMGEMVGDGRRRVAAGRRARSTVRVCCQELGKNDPAWCFPSEINHS